MIALEITSLKQFMNSFLCSDNFDIFLLEQASVTTYNTFQIDGRQNRSFYTKEEWEDSSIRPYEFTRWKDIRGLCFDLIKGTHTPTSFKFVLQLCPEYIEGILKNEDTLLKVSDIKSLVLTLKYDGSNLTLITGTSLKTFIPDKTIDSYWDKAIKRFLVKKQLSFEDL